MQAKKNSGTSTGKRAVTDLPLRDVRDVKGGMFTAFANFSDVKADSTDKLTRT